MPAPTHAQVASEGSSVQAGAAGRHQFGWRDAMDILVKWRQLAEPNDQVRATERGGAGTRATHTGSSGVGTRRRSARWLSRPGACAFGAHTCGMCGGAC